MTWSDPLITTTSGNPPTTTMSGNPSTTTLEHLPTTTQPPTTTMLERPLTTTHPPPPPTTSEPPPATTHPPPPPPTTTWEPPFTTSVPDQNGGNVCGNGGVQHCCNSLGVRFPDLLSCSILSGVCSNGRVYCCNNNNDQSSFVFDHGRNSILTYLASYYRWTCQHKRRQLYGVVPSLLVIWTVSL
uniref:Hydrophobin n=1 Tax=Moniliophthora roreri TaxID=221103 RepID=A0A0W0G6U2_MONRR